MSISDVNHLSKVAIKIYDELDSDKEEFSLIGEAEVDVADVFKSPYHDKRLYIFPRLF